MAGGRIFGFGRTIDPTRLRPRRSLSSALLALTLPPLLGACLALPASPSSPQLAVAERTAGPSGGETLASVPTGAAARTSEPNAGTALQRRLEALFAEARTLVALESGTDLSAIELALVDDAALMAEVATETRRLVNGRLGHDPFATRLLDGLVSSQAGTYAALYSGRRRTVMVSRGMLERYLASLGPDGRGGRGGRGGSGGSGGSSHDEALLVLMLHELTHAADDLRHAIHANRSFDFRASFAQSAVFEGHAQWLTRRICRAHGCLGGLATLDAFMFGGHGDGAPSARSAGRDLLEYSYVEGERFVAALAARPDGARLIERMLAEPPHDPLQILDPASFPDTARESRNRVLLGTAAAIDHPWLGEAGTRVAVETSPLKGVNLRADPQRRRAAVDGFTRLITAMVAMQFHDPAAPVLAPVEVTLMHADTPRTARLFADTLHAHALLAEGAADARDITDGAEGTPSRRLLRTTTRTASGEIWRTAIATGGPYVVQANGGEPTPGPMDDYVLGVLSALLAGDGRA